MITICLKTHAQIESEAWYRQSRCDCDNCRDYRAGTLWEQEHPNKKDKTKAATHE